MMLVLLSLLTVTSLGETNKPELIFATAKEGSRILTTRDDFITRLSPFDRSARMITAKDISESQFLDFVAGNVLEWTDDERAKVQSAIDVVSQGMNSLGIPFPSPVYVIKTTGREEGQACYTRGDAIVFPARELWNRPDILQRKLCHELFHIISRKNPALREKLYGAIGFAKCGELDFPPALQPRRITNPDAPRNDHCIQIEIKGQPRWAVPILYSLSEKYDEKRGGSFFDYLRFEFLLLDEQSPVADVSPVYDSKNPTLLGVNRINGFFEKIGRNTSYIIHPEEILAENFTVLILGSEKIRSPEIISKMRETLTAKPPTHSEAGKK
jgi:hypothetical protein